MEGPEKSKLLILSDMWGEPQGYWIEHYKHLLSPYFQISVLDICALGRINLEEYSQESIHSQFLDGGIEKAVTALSNMNLTFDAVLGFSMGGTKAWKAMNTGLSSAYLFAISATRIRHEYLAPKCAISLYFGEYDQYKPDSQWCLHFNLWPNKVPKKRHDFYRELESAKIISDEIMKTVLA